LLLEEIELFEAAVEVFSYVVPAVSIEVDVFVGPDICEIPVEVQYSYVEILILGESSSGTYTSPLSGLTLAKA
jgi:hypothetical protein